MSARRCDHDDEGATLAGVRFILAVVAVGVAGNVLLVAPLLW